MRKNLTLILLMVMICCFGGIAAADDTTPPHAVDTLVVDLNGDGTTIRLDWTGYDESGQGDIASYLVYVETQAFTDVSTLSANAIVEAGVFTYSVGNLTAGNTYFVAVAAKDTSGNALNEVTPVSVVPTDVLPPEDITDQHIERTENSITLSWNPPADTADDLAGYKVYFNEELEGQSLNLEQNSYEKAGLSPGITYSFRISAYDKAGNENAGVAISATTLLIDSGNIIGEIGRIDDLNHNEKTVLLGIRYQQPVVFAQPPSYNGGDIAVVRITDVQSDRFTFKIHEMPGTADGGGHTNESISYFVFEKGDWQLPDGKLLRVGTISTAVTTGTLLEKDFDGYSFLNSGFGTTPVVISQTQTNNDPLWVKTRLKDISRTGFFVALEEEESKNTPHSAAETVGWLAIEPTGGTLDSHLYKAGLTATVVSHQWYTITGFDGFSQTPFFLASLSSYNGTDNAHLRYQNLTAAGVAVKVEEDTTHDSETEHSAEIVGYIVMDGDGVFSSQPFVDTTPPVLENSDPADGSSVKPVNQISFTVYDPYGSVDENSITTSLVVTDSFDQSVSGSVTASGDQYTFIPDILPLSGDTYQVSFTASDLAGNTQDLSFSFTVDTAPPLPVDTLLVNEEGDGFSVTLDWSGYDESVEEDIKYYRIYQSLSNFSDVSDATLLGTVNAGNFSYSIQNLERDTTYWFAVIAVDFLDNADNQVVAVSGTPNDTVPAEEATGLKAQSVGDTLTFSWNHSINSYNDLAGYRVYFADDTQGVFLPPDQSSYTKTDLDPSTGYPFRVTAVDNAGNESSGVTITGITLLDNPAITTVSPRAGGVKLYWAAGEPSEYVKQYRIYVSEAEFSSVEGMTPRVTTTSLSAAVTGLANGVTYYFAITVVNKSDGERKEVTTISATAVVGTNVSGEIKSNITWSLAGSPYIVTGDITVRHSSLSYGDKVTTLTISPGVQIRFEPGVGIYIGKNIYSSTYDYYGALSAKGTAESPIVFTSNAESPFPGDWKGIYFRNQTDDAKTSLEHCLVEYGGHTNNANIYFASASPAVKNSSIRKSSSHGIYLNASSPTIESNNITDNINYGISANSNSAGWITDNTFSGNGKAPINIHPSAARRVSGNSGSGNGQNYIRVYGGTLTANSTWSKQALPYVIAGDITVRHSGPSYGDKITTLTLNPGVEVRFEPGIGIYIGENYYSNTYDYYGALSAKGTADSPIVFTSNSESPFPGDWKGIYFRTQTDDAKTSLEHCVVEYGGHTNGANIYFASASPTIKNSTIRKSSSHGIYLNASSPTINNNNITDNINYGISANSNSAGWITDNTFSGNGKTPINIHPSAARRVSGNSGSGNGQNYIRVYGGTLTANSTWSKQALPYVIAGDITVRHSGPSYGDKITTLTLNPGVEVRFEPGIGIYIGENYYSNTYDYYGALSAKGTADSPVVFTSNSESPFPGNWKGIYFRTQTDDTKTSLEHCVVEYGGHTHNANIYFASASPTIKNSTIRKSSSHGIYLNASSPTINNNNITDNINYGISANSNSAGWITDNTFSGNGKAPIDIHPSAARRVSGNSGSGNGQNYIRVYGGTLTANSTWSKQALPYVIAGDITVRHSGPSYGDKITTLTLNPGVEVRFEPGDRNLYW